VLTQPRAQGLAVHPVAQFPQFDLQVRPVTAFVVIKNGEHFRFSDRFLRAHRPAQLRNRQA